MLMSGNFPMKNGMVLNDHFLRNPTPFFAEVCRDEGYRTGYMGKWHLDGHGRTAYIPPERWLGFETWRTLECTHQYYKSLYFYQDEKKARTWPGYDAIAQTDEACRFIREEKDGDPFCLFLSWGPPHDPYNPPEEYMERFPPENIRLRENVDDFKMAESMWKDCDTELPEGFLSARDRFMPFLLDRENKEIRKWYAGYNASTEVLDDCMGRILNTLEKEGQLEHTLIVFTSDHGDNLGSHRQYGKSLPYEESISIPFLLRYPGKIKGGTRTDALMSPVDMMPTVLALAGIPCPDVDGMDISGAAMGEDVHAQDALLIMRPIWLGTNWITNGSGPWRGVRTKRYTYARTSDDMKPWLLFDNEKDPWQIRNLVDDPAYSELVEQLDVRTDELLDRAGDPENPLYFSNLIQREREQQSMPDRRQDLFPYYTKPGSGFSKYLELQK